MYVGTGIHYTSTKCAHTHTYVCEYKGKNYLHILRMLSIGYKWHTLQSVKRMFPDHQRKPYFSLLHRFDGPAHDTGPLHVHHSGNVVVHTL